MQLKVQHIKTLFTKTLEECVTEFDRLFYIFKNSEGFKRIPEWIEEAGGISRRLAEACEVAAFDKEKKLKYEIDMMNEWDILAQREFAERKGFEKGYADGEAKALLASGMPIEQIELYTKLSKEQIETIQ